MKKIRLLSTHIGPTAKSRIYEGYGYALKVVNYDHSAPPAVLIQPEDPCYSPRIDYCNGNFLLYPPVINARDSDKLVDGIQNAKAFCQEICQRPKLLKAPPE